MSLRFDYIQDPIAFDPSMKDYAALWDSVYRAKHQAECDDWYRNYARLPGDLAPEYRVWWWRSVGAWKWRLHIWLYEKYHRQLVVREKWLPAIVYRLLEPVFFEYERWYTVEWNHCPHCGFKSEHRDGFIDVFESPWYRFAGGGSYFNGDHTVHYFDGEWTCPRCLRQWEYGDSD